MSQPKRFGRYLVFQRRGQDALGEIYRARWTAGEGGSQRVSLRVFRGGQIVSESLWERLAAGGPVQRPPESPLIGRSLEIGRLGGIVYSSWEYVPGVSLRRLIETARANDTPLATDLALLIVDRVASALAEATRAGCVHGCLVPELVEVSHEGQVRVLGFELAAALRSASGSQPLARYLAPEVLRGEEPTPSSDVWSLSALAWDLLTGNEPPQPADGRASADLRDGRLAAEDAPLPATLSDLLRRGLAAAADRPADPGAWHELLAQAIATEQYTPRVFNLAFSVYGLFRREIELESSDAESEQELAAAAQDVSGTETARPSRDSQAPSGGPAERPSEARQPVGPTEAALAAETAEEPGASDESPVAARPERKVWIGFAAAAVVLVGVGLGVTLLRGPKATAPSTALEERQAAVDPAEAETAAAIAATQSWEEPAAKEPAAPTTTEPAAIAATAPPPTPTEEALERERLLRAQAEEQLRTLQDESEQRASQEREAQLLAEEERRKLEAELAAVREAEERRAREEAEAQAAAEASVAAAAEGTAGASEAPPTPATQRGDLVDLGPGVTPPRIQTRPTPDYPPAARRLGRQAKVTLKVLVDENGRVLDVRSAGGRAGLGFDEAAEKAARASIWSPAVKDGVEVRMWMDMTYEFRP